jgi:hypothetical protein
LAVPWFYCINVKKNAGYKTALIQIAKKMTRMRSSSGVQVIYFLSIVYPVEFSELYITAMPAILQGAIHVGGDYWRPSWITSFHSIHTTEILGGKN